MMPQLALGTTLYRSRGLAQLALNSTSETGFQEGGRLPKEPQMRGVGRAVFVAILLMIAGTLNVIYGIGAIGDAHFYTAGGTHYVFGSLHTWGWITLFIGVVQLIGGFSLLGGGGFGRVIGIFAASIGAIDALLSVGG